MYVLNNNHFDVLSYCREGTQAPILASTLGDDCNMQITLNQKNYALNKKNYIRIYMYNFHVNKTRLLQT